MNKSQNGKGWWHQPCRCVYSLVLYVSFICLQFIDFHFHLLYILEFQIFLSLFWYLHFFDRNPLNKKHIACHISFGTWYPTKTSRLAAPFGPLTPGSVQRHATFLTRDRCLRAPSGGSEYHLEVRVIGLIAFEKISRFGDQITMKFWNSYFVKMWDAYSKLVSGLFQHVLQVWMHLFRMCQKLPSIFPPGTCRSCHSCLRRWCVVRDGIVAGETMWRLWKCWKHKDHTDFFRKMHVKGC